MIKKKRHISAFWTIIFSLILSASSFFLINNIIAVNKGIKDLTTTKDELNKIIQINNTYQIEIEKLSSYDRIKKMAEEKLSMTTNEKSLKSTRTLKINLSELE